MKIIKGHSSENGNWLKFFQRLGVNAARRFVNSMSDLRKFIGTSNWGQNLKGSNVTTQSGFSNAIYVLRTANGRNANYAWKNPVKWSSIFSYMNNSNGVYGSDENALNQLNSINVSTLIVENIGCSGTSFTFQSFNPSSVVYWAERWELYKLSYAMAVWAYNKNVKAIEFYNEPDLDLGGSCLSNASVFIDYYKIRSLSIQNAYEDLNSMSQTGKINIQVVASAFAKKTYGGDITQYLGDVVVKNRNYMFGNSTPIQNWSNMHSYSYHTYGKTGASIASDLSYLKVAIQNDTLNSPNQLPVIITEHNSHTAADWNMLTTTPDDPSEASRLASQVINIVKSNTSSDYVFKFSITPDTSYGIKKNGIHWAENYADPFHLSDTTLSAEAMRLITQFKKSKIYPVASNDTSSYRTYLASNNGDGFFYFFVVNDAADSINVSINLTQWNITTGTQVLVESACDGYYGEIQNILAMPKAGNILSLVISNFSTTRIAIQEGAQIVKTILSNATCTVLAGNQSNSSNCSLFNTQFLVGTSNTVQHENTMVGLIKFELPSGSKINNQKTILKLNVQQVIGSSDVRLQVLGVTTPQAMWNQASPCR